MKKLIIIGLILTVLYSLSFVFALEPDHISITSTALEQRIETNNSFEIIGWVQKTNENTIIVSGELIAFNTVKLLQMLQDNKISNNDLIEINGVIKNKIKIAQNLKIIE